MRREPTLQISFTMTRTSSNLTLWLQLRSIARSTLRSSKLMPRVVSHFYTAVAPPGHEEPLTNLLIGYVRTYIILPTTVWGIAIGPLVDLGVQNPVSIQVPILIDASMDRGQGGMVGAGKNLWGNVNINDSACLLSMFGSIPFSGLPSCGFIHRPVRFHRGQSRGDGAWSLRALLW
jgi:hypothetical protein